MASAYSPTELTIARGVLSAVVMACGAAVVCFWLASTGGATRRKATLILTAFLLLGGSLLALGSAFLYTQTKLQLRHAMGEIVSVDVHGRQTDLLVRTPGGDGVNVLASGRSAYFEIGRRVRIDYQANSRLLVSAVFLSQSGEAVGNYRGSPKWAAYFMVVGGVVLVLMGVSRYRRDPEAMQEPVQRANPLGDFVDTQSLLQLAAARKKIGELED